MSRLFFSPIPCVLFISISSFLGAGDLSGRILDPSGSVIPEVSVTLIDRSTGQKWGEITDDTGGFEFSNRRPGLYLVQAEMPGFRALVREIRLQEDSLEIDFRLTVVGLTDEVVVTATGSPQLTSEVARASSIVAADELEARKESFLGEALLGQPGLRIQRLGGPGTFTKVRFRGLRTADTGLLFNGHRIRDAAGFRGDVTGHFEEIMLSNISRIEVIPGASSHLYGTSSGGGVINLVPRFGKGRPSVQASFEGGALGLFRETFLSEGTIADRLHYSFGALRTDVNEGLDGEDRYRNTSLSSMLEFDLHRDVKVSGMIYFSDTPRLDINESPFPIGPSDNLLGFETGGGPVAGFIPNLNDPDSRRKSHLFTGILSWEHRLNNHWSYSVYSQNTDTGRDFSDGPELDPFLSEIGVFEFPFESSRTDGEIHILGTQHYLRAGEHHLFLVGAEQERESRTSQFLSTPFGIEQGPTTDRQSSTAFFVQDQMNLFNRNLQIIASFRTQFFNIDNPESVPEIQGLETPDAYTGGLAVSYLFRTTGTKIRAQAANGFRAPSLNERFADLDTGLGRLRIGNPLLRPERTLTMDFGLDQFLWDHRWRLSATYFYNRLQEIIVSTEFLQQTNARGGLSRGLELSAQASLARGLDLGAAYTYTNADFIPSFDILRADNRVAPGGLSRPLEGLPAHHWSAGFNYRRGRWNFNAHYVGISSYPEPLFSPRFFRQVLFQFGGYNRVDAGISYTIPTGDQASIEFYARGENILDDTYFEDGFRTPGGKAWGGIRYRFR